MLLNLDVLCRVMSLGIRRRQKSQATSLRRRKKELIAFTIGISVVLTSVGDLAVCCVRLTVLASKGRGIKFYLEGHHCQNLKYQSKDIYNKVPN